MGFPGRPIDGGSNPRIYYFDDDVTRLVKWHPSNQGPKVAYNELVASRLGQLIGAPLLRGAVVYVSDQIIPDDHRRDGSRAGFHFGVTRMEGDNFIPAQHYGEIENVSQLPAAAVQLAWLAVGDQEGHNQYLQRKEATGIGGRRTVRFMLVATGFAFGGANWSATALNLPDSYRLPVHMADKLTVDRLEASIASLAGLADDVIRACFSDCPAEWTIVDEDIAAVTEVALRRRDHIRRIIGDGNPQIK